MKTQLPTLDDLCVESPCPLRWAALRGNDLTRSCEVCGKHVHNLSAMTRAEAERAVADPSVECVTFLRALDGQVITADKPKRPWWRVGLLILGWWASFVLMVVLMLVYGGEEKPKKTTLPDGCEYDPATGCFRAMGKM